MLQYNCTTLGTMQRLTGHCHRSGRAWADSQLQRDTHFNQMKHHLHDIQLSCEMAMESCNRQLCWAAGG